MNYWKYGDYLGIGPGAHTKLSIWRKSFLFDKYLETLRFEKIKSPKNYLNYTIDKLIFNLQYISITDMVFEYMLNNLRLKQGFCEEDLYNKTQCTFKNLQKKINFAIGRNLLRLDNKFFKPTALGWRFLNDLQGLFLPDYNKA